MSEKLDDILKRVLTPAEEPGDILNGKILRKVKETEHMRQKKYKRASAAVIAVVLMVATSLTAYAAWQYRSADSVAEQLGEQKLADAFEMQSLESETGDGMTDLLGVSQNYGGYQVTMLGVTSGKNLTEKKHISNGEIRDDRIYCAVAIKREDGTPVDAENADFFVSPLVGGLNPGVYNAASMCGNYTEFVEDGILYRLLECDNIECFADHELYVCVSDTAFYSSELYHYNEADGTISRNSEYQGLNALFDLQMDSSKADAAKAQALLDDIHKMGEDNSEIELPATAEDALVWAAKLTPDNLEQYCVRMENTVQTMTPDAEGFIELKPWLVNEKVSDTRGGGGGRMNLRYIFSDEEPGLFIEGYGCSEEGLEDLVITTYIRNEDGTVTFAVYVPKEVSKYLE